MDFSNILPYSAKDLSHGQRKLFLLSFTIFGNSYVSGLVAVLKGDSLYKAYVYGLVISGVVLLLAFEK